VVDLLDGVVIVEFEITNHGEETTINWEVETTNGIYAESQTGDTSILSNQQTETVRVTFSGKSAGTYSIDIAIAPNNGEDADTSDNQYVESNFVTVQPSTEPVVPGREGPVVGPDDPPVDTIPNVVYDGGILEITNVLYDVTKHMVNFDAVIQNFAEPALFGLDVAVKDVNGASVAETGGITQLINTEEQETFEGFIEVPILSAGDYYVTVQIYPLDANENVQADADENDNTGYSDYFNIGASGDVTGTTPTSVDLSITNVNIPKTANIDSNVDFKFTVENLGGSLADAGQILYGMGIFDSENNVLYEPENTETLTDGQITIRFNPKTIGLATDIEYRVAVFAILIIIEDSNYGNNLISGTDFGGQMVEGIFDASSTIKFTGTKTVETIIPKTTTKIKTVTKTIPKTTGTKTVKKTIPKTATKTTPGKTTTVNLVPETGIKGPPKLLTEKAFIHGMRGGTLIESAITGKLTPSLNALYPVNPDMIDGLTRQSTQCVIDNAPRWVMYRFNGEKLAPAPAGEPIQVDENEGLVVAISQNDGCQLERVFKSKPKANPLQLTKKGWNLYAMQPELEGKKLTDLQCPAGTRVIEAYNLQSGKWTEMSQWDLSDGASGNIWWTHSVFVRCA